VIFEFLCRALAFILRSMEAISECQNHGNKIKLSLGVLSSIPLNVSWSIGIAAVIFNCSTHSQKAGFTSLLCYPMHSHNCTVLIGLKPEGIPELV